MYRACTQPVRQAWTTLLGTALFAYLPQILFLVLLGVIYIGSRHRSERMIREIETLKVRVADLRAEYMGAQATYMYATRRTEILRRAKALGLHEPTQPPFVLDIQSHESTP